MLVLGLQYQDRKSTKDKANISNTKVNRDCPPLTANHPSADCVQISLWPSIQYIPLSVYRTGGFNNMTIICALSGIENRISAYHFKQCELHPMYLW